MQNWSIGWQDPFKHSFPPSGSTARFARSGTASGRAIFPPWVTLWAFIGQVLDPDHSCNRALARIQAHRAQLGLPPLSPDTGGYCKARQRLPEALFSKLCLQTGAQLAAEADPADRWFGRRVKVVDGSSASMPDTPANQDAYPQPSGQAAGCGFPVIAFVAVFCLATGALLALATGTWFLHDLSLFYFVRDALVFGDIFLADRGFCSYAELALLQQRGVDSVVRLHQRRKADFRRGRLLGLADHLVRWDKPSKCPRGLRKADYRRLPEYLVVRELQYRVDVKGFRTQQITLATTLLDAETYFAEALAELYFLRWDVELDFRHIKTTMQMDVLRCKSPAMVRKEIWTHMLAYNLIRSVMWEAARDGPARARRLSFKGTIQHVLSFRDLWTRPKAGRTEHSLLAFVREQIVPYRPGRIEPRVRKRRPKNYRLMTKPRSELKAALTG